MVESHGKSSSAAAPSQGLSAAVACERTNRSSRCLRLTRHDHQLVSWYCVQRRLVDVEMCLYKLGWRVGQPLRKRHILIEAALEHLQEDQVCIPCILDVMQQGFFHVPDVSRLKVHSASLVTRRHNSHSSFSRDVILPFVGVRVPVQFPHSSRVNRDHCHRNVS